MGGGCRSKVEFICPARGHTTGSAAREALLLLRGLRGRIRLAGSVRRPVCCGEVSSRCRLDALHEQVVIAQAFGDGVIGRQQARHERLVVNGGVLQQIHHFRVHALARLVDLLQQGVGAHIILGGVLHRSDKLGKQRDAVLHRIQLAAKLFGLDLAPTAGILAGLGRPGRIGLCGGGG